MDSSCIPLPSSLVPVLVLAVAASPAGSNHAVQLSLATVVNSSINSSRFQSSLAPPVVHVLNSPRVWLGLASVAVLSSCIRSSNDSVLADTRIPDDNPTDFAFAPFASLLFGARGPDCYAALSHHLLTMLLAVSFLSTWILSGTMDSLVDPFVCRFGLTILTLLFDSPRPTTSRQFQDFCTFLHCPSLRLGQWGSVSVHNSLVCLSVTSLVRLSDSLSGTHLIQTSVLRSVVRPSISSSGTHLGPICWHYFSASHQRGKCHDNQLSEIGHFFFFFQLLRTSTVDCESEVPPKSPYVEISP